MAQEHVWDREQGSSGGPGGIMGVGFTSTLVVGDWANAGEMVGRKNDKESVNKLAILIKRFAFKIIMMVHLIKKC
jgi:hypothetical protein